MSIPGNLLLMMNKLPITEITYNDREENNGEWKPDLREISVNRNTLYSTSELEALQNIFMHEFGHYLDSTADGSKHEISTDPVIKQIYEEELEQFRKNSTSVQQTFLSHIINDSKSEKAGDTVHVLYAQEPSLVGMRVMYFQKDFPRTIAAIAQRCSEKEQLLMSEN